jgi:hypothetical protein
MDDGWTAMLSIAPAGNAAGAAQLVVDHAGGRFVYTGDLGEGAARWHIPRSVDTGFNRCIHRSPDRPRGEFAT